MKALKEIEEKRLEEENPLLFVSDASNQVNRSSSRSKRNKSRTLSNKTKRPQSTTPKRRSRRLTERDKVDNCSVESNDSMASDNFKISHKLNSHVSKGGLVNGSVLKTSRRTSWNLAKNCDKPASSPLNLKPFSNPNLVIRTRRASAIEAEEKSKSESDSELCSPKSSGVSLNKDIAANENSTNSSVLSETC